MARIGSKPVNVAEMLAIKSDTTPLGTESVIIMSYTASFLLIYLLGKDQ